MRFEPVPWRESAGGHGSSGGDQRALRHGLGRRAQALLLLLRQQRQLSDLAVSCLLVLCQVRLRQEDSV